MEIVEEFMNIHISTNMVFTVVIFLMVYGSYFIATYLSCRRMVAEHCASRWTYASSAKGALRKPVNAHQISRIDLSPEVVK